MSDFRRKASQRVVSTSDALQQMLYSEGPVEVLASTGLSTATLAYTRAGVHTLPCAGFSAITLLIGGTFDDATNKLYVRPLLGFKEIDYAIPDHLVNGSSPVGKTVQECYSSAVSEEDLYHPIERELGATYCAGRHVDAEITAGVTGGMRYAITFLTRGARQFSVEYGGAVGSGADIYLNIRAMAHQGSWVGWAK